MTEDTRKFVEEKTKEILNAGSCCPELKEMAEKWLAAEETTDEKAVTEAYLQELSEDVLPIDALISFGGKFCICPACSAGGAILDKKNEIL